MADVMRTVSVPNVSIRRSVSITRTRSARQDTTSQILIAGPAGSPGTSPNKLTLVSGQALGGHRVVTMTAQGLLYASCDRPETTCCVIGITSGSCAQGVDADIVSFGPIEEPSWSWTPGPVFLGMDGLMTQTAPTSGVVLQIGVAPRPTTLLVEIDEPYHLAVS